MCGTKLWELGDVRWAMRTCTEQFYEEDLMNGCVSDDLTTKVYLYDISGLVILAIVCHKLSMHNLI